MQRPKSTQKSRHSDRKLSMSQNVSRGNVSKRQSQVLKQHVSTAYLDSRSNGYGSSKQLVTRKLSSPKHLVIQKQQSSKQTIIDLNYIESGSPIRKRGKGSIIGSSNMSSSTKNKGTNPITYPTRADIEKTICRDKSHTKDGRVHRHTIQSCKEHPFCVDQRMEAIQVIDTMVPLPLHVPDQMKKDYLESIRRGEFGQDGPMLKDRKLVVTKLGMDHWTAENYNVPLYEFPNFRPTNLPKEIFEELKDYPKLSMGVGDQRNKNSCRSLVSYKQRREKEINALIKGIEGTHPQRKSSPDPNIVTTNIGGKQRESIKHRPRDKFKKEPQDMIPLVYLKTIETQPLVHKIEKELEIRQNEYNRMYAGPDQNKSYLGRPMAQTTKSKQASHKRVSSNLKLKSSESPSKTHKRNQTAVNRPRKRNLQNYQPYKRPNKFVRARLSSECLSFMDRSELEAIAGHYYELKKDFDIEIKNKQAITEQPKQQENIDSDTGDYMINSQRLKSDIASSQDKQEVQKVTEIKANATVYKKNQQGAQRLQKAFSKASTNYATERSRPFSSHMKSTRSRQKNPFRSRLLSAKAGSTNVQSLTNTGMMPNASETNIINANRYKTRDLKIVNPHHKTQQAMLLKQYSTEKNTFRAPLSGARQRNKEMAKGLHSGSTVFSSRAINSATGPRPIESAIETANTQAFSHIDPETKRQVSPQVCASLTNSLMKNLQDTNRTELVQPYGEAPNLNEVFNQVTMKKDKDLIIQNFDSNLQRYKPTVPLSQTAKSRLQEKMSSTYSHEYHLQQVLKGYGIKHQREIAIPDECTQILNETKLANNNYLQLTNETNSPIYADLSNKMDSMCGGGIISDTASQIKQSETNRLTQDRIKNVTASFMQKVHNLARDKKKEMDNQMERSVNQTDSHFDSARQNSAHVKSNSGMRFTSKKTSLYPLSRETSEIESNSFGVRNNNKRVSSAANSLKNTMSVAYSQVHSSKNSKGVGSNVLSGIGTKPRGAAQKRIISQIIKDLDVELDEPEITITDDQLLNVPDWPMDSQKLRARINDMKAPDFWLQKGILRSNEGKVDAAMDYYRQGLRLNPDSLELIYNLANSYKKLKKFNNALRWFSHGVSLYPRWVDGLNGLATTFFNKQQHKQALYYISMSIENYKNQKRSPLLSYETISFMRATCMKNCQDYQQAETNYKQLRETFDNERGKDLIKVVWGLMLVPLQDDRKLAYNHLENLKTIIDFEDERPHEVQHQNLLLSKYCKTVNHPREGDTNILDWETYPKSIKTLLLSMSFFKRFKAAQLLEHLKNAQVETFQKGSCVFLRNKIGIVTSGAIQIKTHANANLLKPYAIRKAVAGDIIGFAEGDDNTTLNPLTWMTCFVNDTEVVFVEKNKFQQLWKLHAIDTERQIILSTLETNPLFKTLNMTTKYYLAYEAIEEKLYFPGELIMSIHQRSPLCSAYYEFYKDRVSKFKKDIDQKRVECNNEIASHYESVIKVASQSSESVSLSPKKASRLTIGKRIKKRITIIDHKAEKSQASTMDPVHLQINNRTYGDDQLNQKLTAALGSSVEQISDSSIYSSFASSETDFGVEDAGQMIAHDLEKEEEGNVLLSQIKKAFKAKIAIKTEETSITQDNNNSTETIFQRDQEESTSEAQPFSFQKMFNQTNQAKKQDEKSLDQNLLNLMKFTVVKGVKQIVNIKSQNKKEMRKQLKQQIEERKDRESALLAISNQLIERLNNTSKKKIQKQGSVQLAFGQNLSNPGQQELQKQKAGFAQINLINSTSVLIQRLLTQEYEHFDALGPVQPRRQSIKSPQRKTVENKRMDKKNVLYKKILDIIELSRQAFGSNRVEPSGIHFVEQGEACIVSNEKEPVRMLLKGNCFGEADVIKRPGAEYLGDIRASLRPVKTFFFSYNLLKDRISFPELVRLQETPSSGAIIDCAVQQLAQKNGINSEDLTRY